MKKRNILFLAVKAIATLDSYDFNVVCYRRFLGQRYAKRVDGSEAETAGDFGRN